MTIFVAEDNPADVYLLKEALAAVDERSHDVVVAEDGEEALDLVHRRGAFLGAGRPDLIVLDLNLPKNDGVDILRAVRHLRDLANVPVVILTSSDSPEDRALAEQLGASCYITKPADLDSFLALGETLISYAQCRVSRASGALR